MPRTIGIAVLTLLLTGAPLHAQGASDADLYDPPPLPPVPGWVGEFTMLSANAVLGGVTAGAMQKARGGSFRDGFARGFLGGGVVYGGKRLAVERFAGAGLMGRQVAAAGASMIRNAADGEDALRRLYVPLGPVRLYVDRGAAPAVRLKADINNLILIGYAVAAEELEFDLGGTLSAGTPVFEAREYVFGTPEDTMRASGQVLESVIFMSDLPWRSAAETAEIFAHERVHVLQKDQVFITIAEPISAAVFGRVERLEGLYRYFDLHPTNLLFDLLQVAFPEYETRPSEMEAFHLSRR